MSEHPLVSILILNYRSAAQAVQCAEAYKRQTVAARCEIIVIDNHSDNDSMGILRIRRKGSGPLPPTSPPKGPDPRIVEAPRNLGFGGGYNLGARYARGKYLLINNPDKILERDGVEKLVAKMESDASIGILAPKLVHDDGTVRTSARTLPDPFDLIVKRTSLQRLFPQRLRSYLQLDRDPNEEREVDWVVGGCFLVRRDLFLELGGFDERFFLFFEDTDFCRRVRELGKRVVYYPAVSGTDRKRRLSEGSALRLLTTRVGRAHVASAAKYFWKWRART